MEKLPTERHISVPKLRLDLGFRHKLPAHFDFTKEMELFHGSGTDMRWLKSMGMWQVVFKPTVKTSAKSSKHRIFIKCSCGREIPAGRFAQHKHEDNKDN